ncbi:radical SAM protein [Clostridium sediminicola]|uniref:radical SAM protein n=1 Tax=Clostridium sediminicola TaxID=3114879 RepID=UPI0031F23F53
MRYEGAIYRPPSEAYSLLIQVSFGCSHNKCVFCNMFKNQKFRIRKLEEVFEDLETAREQYREVKRVFLIDGDALFLKTENLEKILLKIKELFPECERVGLSATAQDVLRKGEDDLRRLKELGLKIIYMGVESGSDEILKDNNKGSTAEEMIQAGQLVRKAGIKLSVSLISGLGGKEKWEMHAVGTARVISAMNPDYIGLLTLIVDENTGMYEKIAKGEITLLSPKEVMIETRKFVENLELTNCLFRGNHASNYAPISATLNKDKDQLLKQLDSFIEADHSFKSDNFRRL